MMNNSEEIIANNVYPTRQLLDFEEMPIWQAAQDLAVEIYRDTASLRDFSFADQIRRAVISISNNIAEGAERVTATEFAKFLDIAKGSTGEVRSMCRLGQRPGYISIKAAQKQSESCKIISKQLGSFAKHLRRK